MRGCSYAVLSHAHIPAYAAFGIIRKYSGIPTAVGSQPGLLSICLMLCSSVIRCGTWRKPLHCSFSSPHLILQLWQVGNNVYSLWFPTVPTDVGMPPQTAFLVVMSTANTCQLFFRALCLFSLWLLWKAWEVCVSTSVYNTASFECCQAVGWKMSDLRFIHINPALIWTRSSCECSIYFKLKFTPSTLDKLRGYHHSSMISM